MHNVFFAIAIRDNVKTDSTWAPLEMPAANQYPYLQHDGFIAIAHRGGASQWPENSMRAFRGAVELGYHYIETDVHVTSDGVLLAFHDDVLDRVTDVQGRIATMPYAAVREALIDGQEPIPRLEEVLAEFPETKFNLDPKHDSVVEPLARQLLHMDAVPRVCVGSFSGERLRRIRELLGPTLCTSMGPAEVLRLRLASFGLPVGDFASACAQVPTHHRGIPTADRRFIDAAHQRGLQVHVWTIDDEVEMERLLELGVDALMTDEPERLRTVLRKLGRWI
jgi:glycerophosphoryl diester phosphodiesterase